MQRYLDPGLVHLTKDVQGLGLSVWGRMDHQNSAGFRSLGFGFRNSECFHVFMQWYVFEVPSQRDVMSCHMALLHGMQDMSKSYFWGTFIAGYGVIRYTGPRPQRRAEWSSRGPC